MYLMGIDRSSIQIMRIQVQADGTVYDVEFPVPKLGDDIKAVTVTGLGDPKKLGGEWVVDPLSREQWEDLR